MKRLLIVGCIVLISACASPGREGLEENGAKGSIEVSRNYQALAKCLVQKFDNEESGMMVIQTPVTMYRHYDDEKAIELAHMASVGNVYLWTMKLKFLSQTKTLINYTARKKVNPYLSYDYMKSKIQANIALCKI